MVKVRHRRAPRDSSSCPSEPKLHNREKKPYPQTVLRFGPTASSSTCPAWSVNTTGLLFTARPADSAAPAPPSDDYLTPARESGAQLLPMLHKLLPYMGIPGYDLSLPASRSLDIVPHLSSLATSNNGQGNSTLEQSSAIADTPFDFLHRHQLFTSKRCGLSPNIRSQSAPLRRTGKCRRRILVLVSPLQQPDVAHEHKYKIRTSIGNSLLSKMERQEFDSQFDWHFR